MKIKYVTLVPIAGLCLSFSFIYIYIYIYVCVCVCVYRYVYYMSFPRHLCSKKWEIIIYLFFAFVFFLQ